MIDVGWFVVLVYVVHLMGGFLYGERNDGCQLGFNKVWGNGVDCDVMFVY